MAGLPSADLTARRFRDRVALITGGSMGLGLATARRIASEGGTVVIMARSEHVLKDAVADVEGVVPGARVKGVPGDVTVPRDVDRLFTETMVDFGRIDALFNNAGIDGPTASLEDHRLEDFEALLRTNLQGAFHVLRSAVRLMREQGSGSIVNCSSIAGSRSVPDFGGYGASKAALEALTRSAASEYGRWGIRVNAVAPGPIWTPMVEQWLRSTHPDDPSEAERLRTQRNPMSRFGQAIEVAAAVAFLLSSDASYINGAILPVDGGQSVQY